MLISTELQAVAAAMAAGLPVGDAAEQVIGLCARVEVLEKRLTERKRHMLYLWTDGHHWVAAEDEDHLWMLLRQHLGIDVQTQDDMARWKPCPADQTVGFLANGDIWHFYPDQWAEAAGPGVVATRGRDLTLSYAILRNPQHLDLAGAGISRLYAYNEADWKCPPHRWDRDGEKCVKCGASDWMHDETGAEGTKPPAEGGAPGAA